MRVRVLKPVTAYWNYSITTYQPGEELIGDLAQHLADNTPAGSVEVLDGSPAINPGPAVAQDAPAATDTPGPDGVQPPVDGTIGDLMAWVDGDPSRAAAALAAEQAKDNPRSTVIKRLSALVEE